MLLCHTSLIVKPTAKLLIWIALTNNAPALKNKDKWLQVFQGGIFQGVAMSNYFPFRGPSCELLEVKIKAIF